MLTDGRYARAAPGMTGFVIVLCFEILALCYPPSRLTGLV